MPVNPISPAASGPSAGIGPITAGVGEANKSASDTWMKLLLAQARNPNPFGDSDPSATVTQMAQFQMVSALDDLGKVMRSQAATGQVQTASAVLGRTVSYLDATGAERTGVASGLRVTTDGARIVVGNDEISLSQLRTVSSGAAGA